MSNPPAAALATGVRGAVRRTAHALVGALTLPERAQGALDEIRDALGLDLAARYAPPDDSRPVLVRVATAPGTPHVSVDRERLVFDDDAWRLAVQHDAPLVLRERGEWLVEHPFTPPVDSWFLLPLGTRAQRL